MTETDHHQRDPQAGNRDRERNQVDDDGRGMGRHGRYQGRSGFHSERSELDRGRDEDRMPSSYGFDEDYEAQDSRYYGRDRSGGSSQYDRGQQQSGRGSYDEQHERGRRRQYDPRFGDWYAGDRGRRSGRQYSSGHGAELGIEREPYETYPGIASGPSGWSGGAATDSGTGRHRRFESYGRGRHAGRGPKDYTRSDERIREDVCERLTEADDIDASEISVTVKDGVVQLTGSVEERWTKHQAEDIADGCSGVKDVRNEIRVSRTDRGSTGSGSGSGSESASGQDSGNGANQGSSRGSSRRSG